MPKILLFFLCLIVAGGLQAHQQKEAQTTISFNSRVGVWEVVHRFNTHDLEDAARQLHGKYADMYTSEKYRRLMGRYAAEKFSMRIDSEKEVELTYIGHEIEGKYFWVYQEASLAYIPNEIMISNLFLFDIWPTQRNLVNVEYMGNIQSLNFTAGVGWKTVTIPKTSTPSS